MYLDNKNISFENVTGTREFYFSCNMMSVIIRIRVMKTYEKIATQLQK